MARRAGAGAQVTGSADVARIRLTIHGAVQGVGFRPFVHALATSLQLRGWVSNSTQGVCLEVEGERRNLAHFRQRLETDKPVHAVIHGLEQSWLDPAGYSSFEIRPSDTRGANSAFLLPDIATCSACRHEIFDPSDRRFRYAFTNCTHCGPRFSIVESLPYDRSRTAMKRFPMCARCRAEYEDPTDRRFHAQPNACGTCGPQLALWDATGRRTADGDAALRGAAAAIRHGAIVALKGLGGFQLVVDARDEAAVRRLRERKQREGKPLALLAPDLAAVGGLCELSAAEARTLLAPAAPIVLLRRRADVSPVIAASVAPGNPCLGFMLPYTPLHHLLMAELAFPVVATSGNRSEEPICVDERVALERLAGIADVFLVHDRPIVRHVDDSVVRVLLDRELVLRRARGYAPMPVAVRGRSEVVLAVGAHLKNTVALGVQGQAFLSQHVGDLDTVAAVAAFRDAIASLRSLFPGPPQRVAADAHPDYFSTRHAGELGLPVVAVQHHHAHVAACMADNDLDPPVLGVAWDGTGYGLDGSVWGGELFRVTTSGFERLAALRRFRLPGGERAVREPRRAALGVLYELHGPPGLQAAELPPLAAFTASEKRVLVRLLECGVQAPWTTSAGRLFDAVAALVGIRQTVQFEGQAAMELEFAIDPQADDAAYPIALHDHPDARRDVASHAVPRWILDWAPAIEALVEDRRRGAGIGTIARRFHLALVEAIVAVARAAGEPRVVLSGGCFQNAFLTEQCVRRLANAGFRPYWHQRVPPNDGGIALGQVALAAGSARSADRSQGAAGSLAGSRRRMGPGPGANAQPAGA